MPDYTVLFPLRSNNISLGYETINENNIKELAVFNLKNIILTNPGERIMQPSFGVGIKRYLFEQANPGTQLEIRNQIIAQVKRYAPYIDVISIDISSEDNTLNLILKYEVSTAEIAGELVLTVAP